MTRKQAERLVDDLLQAAYDREQSLSEEKTGEVLRKIKEKIIRLLETCNA